MKYTKFQIIVAIAVLLFITFSVGAYMGLHHQKELSQILGFSPAKELHQSGYKYISPILDYEDPDSDVKPFEKDLQALIDQEKAGDKVDDVGAYYRDLNNGPWYGVNLDFQFSPASLLKVPVMISYYLKAESDPSLLQKKIVYQRDPKTTDETTMVSGQSYSVDEIINIMIMNSDNEAKRLLTADNSIDFQKPYKDLDVTYPLIQGLDNNMSVREYARFFRVLYNASYLNKDMSSKALELLTKTSFNDALRAGVPSDVDVAHKYGERILPDGSEQLHDCGIVYEKTRPYLLCVMTNGTDVNALKGVIKDISTLVYSKVHTNASQ